MIHEKTLLNSIGIGLTMLGVYIVYINSPINYTDIDGGDASTNWEAIERKARRRNILLKAGVYLVLAGSAAQLASNFVLPDSPTAA